MKRFIILMLLSSLLLCGCRPIDIEGDDTTPAINMDVEYKEPETELDRTNDGKTIICVDAGHGFDDVGCGPYLMGCYEKEVTLRAAKKLKTELESLGAEVILTHDGETYPSEAQLIADAERLGITLKENGIKENNIFSAYERGIYEEILTRDARIDFFISLHVNSVEHADYVDGFELYYCEDNPEGETIVRFGNNLDAALEGDFLMDATEYDDSYIVTKYAKIPSVLLEMGYATNKTDAKNMTDDGWLSQLAESLAREIVNIVEN